MAAPAFLYTDGASRWNLRIPGCWTRRNVSSRTGSRKYHFRTPARSIKEESSRLIKTRSHDRRILYKRKIRIGKGTIQYV